MMLFTKKMGLMLAGALTSYSLALPSNAEDSSTIQSQEQTQKQIEQVVNSYTSNSAFEGTILVAKSGKIVFEKAYGLSDQAKNQQTTISHSFQLASLSKPITATLMLMLEEQGKLKLDDTLADYFPEFNNPFGKKVTLHHLLSHTSGMPDHFAINGWFDVDFHKKTSEKEFTVEIAKLSPKFEVGEDYLYSNLGYFLLGKIIEKVTGKSYAENLQKQLLSPLNMGQSGVAKGFQLNPETAKGYRWNHNGGYHEQVAKNMSLFGAGAAIYSSVKDLYRFDMALYGDKLINKQSKARLFNTENSYGWRVGRVVVSPEHEVNVHMYDGQFDGYSSMMTRFIDDKHSIIILSNVGISYFLKQQLTFDIAAVLYDQEAINRTKDVSLMLIQSLVSGTFDQTLTRIQSDKAEKSYNEPSLSAFAYQMLWSGLGDKSLQLFSLVSNTFPDSSTAKRNLIQACNHRVTSESKSRESFCN
ncbi:MAG: beta-lactamase family protein [Colwellia sp.]|nr:beta-lactamase family protein [Colwellia sp.]